MCGTSLFKIICCLLLGGTSSILRTFLGGTSVKYTLYIGLHVTINYCDVKRSLYNVEKMHSIVGDAEFETNLQTSYFLLVTSPADTGQWPPLSDVGIIAVSLSFLW